MTSKAAKKAYSKSNQTPRVSRAEQRRRDAEEVDRLKKEAEKEKRTRAAKAAREKKAEKEEQEKKERRLRGEAEKSRWVRASQPSIKGFVRGGKRKRADEEGSEGSLSEDEEERDAKRLPVVAGQDEEVVQKQADSERDMVVEQFGLHSSPRVNTGLGKGKEVNAELDSEDEFGDFPALSQPALLEAMLSSSIKSSPPIMRRPQPRAGISVQVEGARNVPSQELPAHRKHHDGDILYGNSQDEADLLHAQIRSEEADAAARSDPLESRHNKNNTPPFRPVRVEKRPKMPAMRENANPPICRVSHEKQLPSKEIHQQTTQNQHTFKIPALPQPRKPISTKSEQTKSAKEYPPPSTQAFLEDNIDDFILTPSQEAREMEEDTDDEVALPRNPSAKSPHLRPKFAPRSVVDDLIDDFICTQDFILSSQDLEEISPAKMKPHVQYKPSVVSKQAMPPPTFKKPPIPKSRVKFLKNDTAIRKPSAAIASKPSVEVNNFLDDCPCTQDLVLSPSDLEELNTPSKVASPGVSKTKNNLDLEMGSLLAGTFRASPSVSDIQEPIKHNLPQPPHHESSTASFTKKPSNKTKVRPHSSPPIPIKQPIPQRGALLENNPNTSVVPQTELHQKNSPYTLKPARQQYSKLSSDPSSHPILEPNHELLTTSTKPKPKPRFFEEKENDLFQAALHESKVMAEQKTSTSVPGSKRRNRGSGGTGKVEAKTEKRVLKRVGSLVSDYGEDEFEGMCEEDLLSVLS